jgi:hypothetical protein
LPFASLLRGKYLKAVIGLHAVLIDVEATEFLISGDPQAHQVLDQPEKEKTGGHGPGKDRDNAQALSTKEFPSSTKEEAIPGCPW